MSLTVDQLLSDARRLALRLRSHDASAENVISSAQEALKGVEQMKEYQEEVDGLNQVANNRPRAQLVLGIQQENRHIRQLQQENKELRAALEESQNAIELIMSKYRQHMTYLVNTTKLDKNLINYQRARLLQDKTDQICEMAGVIQKSIQIDEEGAVKDQEVHSRILTENKGLREMLEISRRNGSNQTPIIAPKSVTRGCQTETVVSSSFACPAPSATPTASLPSAAVATSSALSPTGNRPVSSSSSYCSSSSPTSVIMMASSDVLGNGGGLSESSEDDEVTFNTIRRNSKAKVNVSDNSEPEPEPKSDSSNGEAGKRLNGINGGKDDNSSSDISSKDSSVLAENLINERDKENGHEIVYNGQKEEEEEEKEGNEDKALSESGKTNPH